MNRESKHGACQQFIKKHGTHHVVATAVVSEEDDDPGAVIDALIQDALHNNFGVHDDEGEKQAGFHFIRLVYTKDSLNTFTIEVLE